MTKYDCPDCNGYHCVVEVRPGADRWKCKRCGSAHSLETLTDAG